MAFRDTISSEIPSLHAVVSNSPDLRILDLSIDQAGSEKRASEGGGFGPLFEADIPSPLVSGYQFPQLESLTIPVRWPWVTIAPEAIPLLTCSLLNLAAKWNHIRQLKLTGLDPNFSFRHLRGSVPNLKRLDIALQHSEVAVADFISSINRLEELRITNYKTEIHLDVLCAAIIKHQASLKTLMFHTPMDSQFRIQTPYWRPDQLEQLRDLKLLHLELDLRWEDATWNDQRLSVQPVTDQLQAITLHPSSGALLTSFSQIKKLKVWIELPLTASTFSEEYRYDGLHGSVLPPPLLEETGKIAATSLFRQIYSQNLRAQLEHLELCFTAFYIGDRMQAQKVEWPIVVKRLVQEECSGAELHLDVTSQKHWA